MDKNHTPESPKSLTERIEDLRQAAGRLAAEASQLSLAAKHPDAELLDGTTRHTVQETVGMLGCAVESVIRVGDQIRSATITAIVDEQEQTQLKE